MGFWRAGPMHCFGAGLFSSTTGTAGSTNCGEKTAASALKAPGMTGVDSTGASVTTSCFGTRTTRTLPALFSRNVNSPPWDALTRDSAPTPNLARRAFDRSTAVNEGMRGAEQRDSPPFEFVDNERVATALSPDTLY